MKNNRIIICISLLCGTPLLSKTVDAEKKNLQSDKVHTANIEGVESADAKAVEKALKNKKLTDDDVRAALEKSNKTEADIKKDKNSTRSATEKENRTKTTELLLQEFNKRRFGKLKEEIEAKKAKQAS